MKYLALSVLLAVVQAATPVPRKAANPSNRAAQNVKSNPNNNQGPTPQPPTVVQPVSSQPEKNNGQGPATDNAPKTVIVRELPPVSVMKDRLDKLYIFFTGVLIIVGYFGVRAAYKTLKAIEQQVGEMKIQRGTMEKQWTTMQGQLAQMESSGKQTDRLIEKAGQQIEEMAEQRSVMGNQLSAMQGQLTAMNQQGWTMKQSLAVARANVEASINEKRARIKIRVTDVNLGALNVDAGQVPTNMVTAGLLNYGPTIAFIDDFRARYLHAPDEDVRPDYSTCKPLAYSESLAPDAPTKMMYGVILEPNAGFLTEDEIMKIKKGESFLHFYGFVRYRNVYERRRTQTIHTRWTMRWGGMMNGQTMQYWSPVGPPEDNQDYEIQEDPEY